MKTIILVKFGDNEDCEHEFEVTAVTDCYMI